MSVILKRLLLTSCVAVLSAGCAAATPQQAPSAVTGPCPSTTPPPVVLPPPPTAGTGPNPSLQFRADANTFLYGNEALVVLLPKDGILRASDPSQGLSDGVKFPWWRIAHGDLTITTRRLDATSAPLAADIPSGYGDTGFQVSGLKFPATGCWEVAGMVGGKTLTFVVNVAR
jgi:hypothetical protein